MDRAEAALRMSEQALSESHGAFLIVSSLRLDDEGHLLFTAPDGEIVNLGNLRGAPGQDGRDGRDGKDGAAGERGADGQPGKMPLIKKWSGGVCYRADVVTHNGATYQAIRDTGKEPPGEDWLCIAAGGRDGEDGRSFTVKGTYAVEAEYRAMDVVALNGASFVAKTDNPGQCPGDGWQMIASQGKRGNPGERGYGTRGEPGAAGPPVVAMEVDDRGLLTLTNGDGSTVTCDFYPLLAKALR